MSYTAIVSDRRAGLLDHMKRVAAEMHGEAAVGARAAVVEDLNGAGPLNSDTGSLRESLWVMDKAGADDFSERRAAAKEAYVGDSSRYADIVREVLDSNAYDAQHFEERAADSEVPLSGDELAALGTMLAYGWWWHSGHFNLLTHKWEQASWFIEPVARWFASEMESHMRDFGARVEAGL